MYRHTTLATSHGLKYLSTRCIDQLFQGQDSVQDIAKYLREGIKYCSVHPPSAFLCQMLLFPPYPVADKLLLLQFLLQKPRYEKVRDVERKRKCEGKDSGRLYICTFSSPLHCSLLQIQGMGGERQ